MARGSAIFPSHSPRIVITSRRGKKPRYSLERACCNALSMERVSLFSRARNFNCKKEERRKKKRRQHPRCLRTFNAIREGKFPLAEISEPTGLSVYLDNL